VSDIQTIEATYQKFLLCISSHGQWKTYTHTKNKKCTQRAQTSTDPEDPDGGFRTLVSRIQSVIRIATKIVSLGPWAICPIPLQKISSKSVHKFASNPTDRQTNRPNQKHSAEVIKHVHFLVLIWELLQMPPTTTTTTTTRDTTVQPLGRHITSKQVGLVTVVPW